MFLFSLSITSFTYAECVQWLDVALHKIHDGRTNSLVVVARNLCMWVTRNSQYAVEMHVNALCRRRWFVNLWFSVLDLFFIFRFQCTVGAVYSLFRRHSSLPMHIINLVETIQHTNDMFWPKTANTWFIIFGFTVDV